MSYIQQIENDEYEANAAYDYIREANAGMVETREQLDAEMEACAREWQAEQDELDAAFGPAVLRPVYDNDEIPF